MYPKILYNTFPSNVQTRYFLLTTRKTYSKCGKKFFNFIRTSIPVECIYIPDGEENKTLKTAEKIWIKLSRQGMGREDVLVCLGGGMVTDIGGFCASVFKRGTRLIHVPTTLLGMVDAAVGGKNGVNFGSVKNMLGTFYFPEAIVIHTGFLETLPQSEFTNGLTEMIKIGLIYDEPYYHAITKKEMYKKNILISIRDAIRLKTEIVRKDPYEKKLRKVLNFGHTFGHALEAWFMENKHPVSHGKAVASGMIMECFLSLMKGHLKEDCFMKIANDIGLHLDAGLPLIPNYTELIKYMQNDKKNKNKKILCVGLKEPGHPVFDISVSKEDVRTVLKLYSAWWRALK